MTTRRRSVYRELQCSHRFIRVWILCIIMQKKGRNFRGFSCNYTSRNNCCCVLKPFDNRQLSRTHVTKTKSVKVANRESYFKVVHSNERKLSARPPSEYCIFIKEKSVMHHLYNSWLATCCLVTLLCWHYNIELIVS